MTWLGAARLITLTGVALGIAAVIMGARPYWWEACAWLAVLAAWAVIGTARR